MTFAELAGALGRDPRRWASGRRHLRLLEERGLARSWGRPRRWSVTEEGRRLLAALAGAGQPARPPLKVYLAGAPPATRVLAALGLRVPYLLGAGVYWRGGRFAPVKDLSFASEVFVDSGAQQFYRKFKGFEYPYTPRQHLEFALSVNADLVATLDLPLDILTPRGLPVEEGVRRTVELGVQGIEEAEKLGARNRVVPVLQGYDDPGQWLESLDLYREHGVRRSPSGVWGVGSLCMARGYRLPLQVLSELRKALPEGESIHVFGPALNVVKKVYMLIDSFDTSAWVYWAKMDGAFFAWDPLRRRFVEAQPRAGMRYDTLSLMAMNARAVLDMARDLAEDKARRLAARA